MLLHTDCTPTAGPLQINPSLLGRGGSNCGGLILPFSNARPFREAAWTLNCQPNTIEKGGQHVCTMANLFVVFYCRFKCLDSV